MHEIAFTLPPTAWKPSSSPHVLYTSLSVNGVLFHVEAWEMRLDKDGVLETVNPEYQSDYDHVYQGIVREGSPQTIDIAGRPYFVAMAS